MEYACALRDNCTQQDSNNLEHVKLGAGRTVTSLPLYASRETLHFETGWELPVDRRKSRKLNVFSSCYIEGLPFIISEPACCLNTFVSDYDLQNSNNNVVPRYSQDITRKSFCLSILLLN